MNEGWGFYLSRSYVRTSHCSRELLTAAEGV